MSRSDDVREFLRAAFGLEFRTAPGKINWGGLVLCFLLVVILSSVDWIILAADILSGGHGVDAAETNVLQLFYSFAGLLIICMAMCMIDAHGERKARGALGGEGPKQVTGGDDA